MLTIGLLLINITFKQNATTITLTFDSFLILIVSL